MSIAIQEVADGKLDEQLEQMNQLEQSQPQ